MCVYSVKGGGEGVVVDRALVERRKGQGEGREERMSGAAGRGLDPPAAMGAAWQGGKRSTSFDRKRRKLE